MENNFKSFSKYSDAYALYSDIVAGRDVDRKNASIVSVDGFFRVYWQTV